MLTQIERDRMASRWFPFQLSIKSDDGKWRAYNGYASKAKADKAARLIFKHPSLSWNPVKVMMHHNETGKIINVRCS